MLHALAVRRPSYQETLRLSDQLRAWHDAQARLPAHLVHPQHRLHRLQNYTIMHPHHTRAHRKGDRDLRPARSRQTAAAPARRAYSSERAPPANQDSVRRPQSTTTAPPPVCDDTDPVTRVSSSSSAGVCPGHRSGAFARRHEIGDMYVPPSPSPCVWAPAAADAASHALPLLLHPHHHPISTTSPPLPAPSQDMYCDLGAGGYMAMTAPDAQCPAPGFGPVSDLDTLLYSTEGVNWAVSPDPVRIYRRPLTDFF
ncbi:hypothetical protein ARSEF4850_001716 [Beauveria asiatica]